MHSSSNILQHGEYDLSELQVLIIETLKVFHDFCQEHDLTYHLGGGTLLGAIRHKGIIPWDDDIDIDMPREDYNRFLKLSKHFPENYIVKHYRLDSNYVYPFIKIYNPKIQVTEFFGKKSYTNGAWIDVFPMDGVVNNILLRKIHFFCVRKLRFVFELKSRGYQNPQNRSSSLYYLKLIVKPIIFTLFKIIPKKWVFFIMDKSASLISYRKAKYIGAFYSPYGIKASFPKIIYNKTLLADFNNNKFCIPSGYDYFLKNQYGDYMTPPLMKDRQAHNIEINNIK